MTFIGSVDGYFCMCVVCISIVYCQLLWRIKESILNPDGVIIPYQRMTFHLFYFNPLKTFLERKKKQKIDVNDAVALKRMCNIQNITTWTASSDPAQWWASISCLPTFTTDPTLSSFASYSASNAWCFWYLLWMRWNFWFLVIKII